MRINDNQINYRLNAEQKKHWKQHGFLKITDLFTQDEKVAIELWVDEIYNWPETPGKWMKYFETRNHKRMVCRVENFLDYHSGMKELLSGKRTIGILSELMSEDAVLFKEKINYKLAGGNGFPPHQDAPAFLSFDQFYHITMMVAIDQSVIANGCLQVVKGGTNNTKFMLQNKDGSINNELVKTLQWTPIECEVGDLLLFDSYLPHYSEPNNSDHSRRALFVTYNRASDGGSKRTQYYLDKRDKFPPECERDPNKDYSKGAEVYNIATPIANQ